MIEFNRILNPRLVTWLVRTFGMKIGGSPAPTLAPEVAPSIDVNQQDDPTLRFIRGERIFGGGLFFTASVGNINRAQIRNPSNSGVIIVITGVQNITPSGILHGVGIQVGDLAGGSWLPQLRDTRWFASGGTRSAASCTYDQTAAPTAPLQGYTLPNAVEEVEIVVPPGSAWQAINGTANQSGWLVVQYYERPIAAEELATG